VDQRQQAVAVVVAAILPVHPGLRLVGRVAQAVKILHSSVLLTAVLLAAVLVA
jgi:hypothetical protein